MTFRSYLTRRRFMGTSLLSGIVAFGDPALRANEPATVSALPRISPEQAGISSRHIIDFIEGMKAGGHELHGLMILRKGKVLAEGWAEPYGPEINHSMYSLSKSFTSTAVGLAIKEGLFQITDKVVSFFPDEAPETLSKHLDAMEVRHLLEMSAGMGKKASSNVFNTQHWVKAFLSEPVDFPPGSAFDYNTAATYMLSAIIQKVSGEKLIDFLKPRLFDKIGIVGATWDECPAGISKGGFGLNINTEGLARFGQLYLQNGFWNGEQVVPKEWIREATSKQIQQEADDNQNPDWQQGYGYQFWRCQHNAYRGDGAFGQFTVVIPEKEIVIVMSSESASMQDELNLMWKHLLPHFAEEELPPDPEQLAKTKAYLESIHVPFPGRGSVGTLPLEKPEGIIRFEHPNSLKLESLTFHFKNDAAEFAGKSDERGDWGVEAGVREWKRGRMPVAVSNSWLVSKGKVDERGFSKVAVSGGWVDRTTYEMAWRYYETPHHDLVRLHFDGDIVTLELYDSISLRRGKTGKPKMTLKGNCFR